MSIKDIFTMEEPIYTILSKMCGMVGTNICKINFQDSKWFSKHTWTEKQQEEFVEWLVNFLYNNYKARKQFLSIPKKNKKYIQKAVGEWIFQYGWKTQ
jgi:hypothetical protein